MLKYYDEIPPTGSTEISFKVVPSFPKAMLGDEKSIGQLF